MPTIRIINETQVPLHIALTQIGPLHWENNVSPQATATLKPGPVFFTIEARLARGTDNEYDNLQRFVPIAVVTVSVVTLGVGAFYFAGAAAAAGSASAVVARISASLASRAPTVRRLYKYARRSGQIARIGNIIGIGGSVLAGKKVAEAESGGGGIRAEEAPQPSRFSLFGGKSKSSKEAEKAEKRQTKQSMKILQGLVAGSVVSSPGWFLNRDRTLRITGGPRATEVDGMLVIETDTLQPFTIVEETGKTLAKGKSEQELLQAGEQAQLAAAAAAREASGAEAGDAAGSGGDAAAAQLRRSKSTPGHAGGASASADAAASDSDSDSSASRPGATSGTSTPAGTMKDRLAEWSASIGAATEGALQRGSTMYARWKPGSAAAAKAGGGQDAGSSSAKTPEAASSDAKVDEKEGGAAPADGTAAVETEKPDIDTPAAAAANTATATPTPPDASDDISPLEALLEMGFSPIEANEALQRHKGELKPAIEDLLAQDREEVRQLALAVPLPASPPAVGDGGEEKSLDGTVLLAAGSDAGGAPAPGSTSASTAQAAATTPALDADAAKPARTTSPALRVVGGEALETPHWTTKARDAAAAATSSGLGRIAVAEVTARSMAFLEGDAKGGATSASRGKSAAAGKKTEQKAGGKVGSDAGSSSGWGSSWMKRSKSETPKSGK